MSAFKLHTLKQKLWAIVAASFVARVIVFFVLPSTPSSLAPDEGTYAALTKWVGESKSVDEFPAYGRGLYLSGRTIITPASLLYRADINELDAIRLISTVYGFCSLVILALFTLKIHGLKTDITLKAKHNENLIAVLFLVMAFLPSHFVWSNLGLRESATEFWLLSTFIVFFLIFQIRKIITFPTLLILFVSIVLTFSARPQVGWVVGVSLILFLLLNVKNSAAYFLIPLVLCAVVFGSTLNLGSTLSPVSTLSPGSTESTQSTQSTQSTESVLGGAFKPLITAGEVVSYKQGVNQLDAATVIKTQSCPRESSALTTTPSTKIDAYFCIAWRAPYMVSTFLFRPILGLDVTSTSSLIAAIENIFWFALFATIFILSVRRRAISFLAPILPALMFFLLYALGASAYQGNMGTGFRHKSLILWVILLLILALAWKKPEEVLKNPTSNSQENAV